MGYYTIHDCLYVICKPIEVSLESKVSPFINFSEAPEKIKQHYVLSRYIEDSGVELRQMGREAVGLCPFKEEKTPSFSVNDEKGVYLCRGCGATGDIITYVAESTGVSQGRAIRLLAEKMGYQVRSESDRQGEKGQKASTSINRASRSDMIEVHDHTAQVAHAYLLRVLSDPQHPVSRYLKQRAFGPDLVKRYGLGFLPSDSPLWSHISGSSAYNAQPTSFSAPHWRTLAQESGLLKDRHQVSMFQGRLLFPITNGDGRCVAFSGRVVPGMESAAIMPDRKYLNSPESFIFSKSQTLYGVTPWHATLNHEGVREAWRRIKSENRVVAVEGVTDVLRIAELDTWAVASLGTAITETHIALLFRFADTICMLTDGDSAGIAASERALLIGFSQLSAGKRFVAAHLPQKEDPDTYFQGVVQCPNPCEHFWHLISGLPHAQPEQVWFDRVIGMVNSPVSIGDTVLIDQALSEDASVSLPSDAHWRVAILRYVYDRTGYCPAGIGRNGVRGTVHPAHEQRWVLDDAARFWLYRVARAPFILPDLFAGKLDEWWSKDVRAGLLASEIDCPPAFRILVRAAQHIQDSGAAISPDDHWPVLADALIKAGAPSSLVITWSQVLSDGDGAMATLGYGDEALVPDLWVAEFQEWAESIIAAFSRTLDQAVNRSALSPS